MTFCLYELAINPDIQEVLRSEIDTVLEKHDGNISYEAIHEMTYLDKVVAGKLNIESLISNEISVWIYRVSIRCMS